MGTVVAIVVPLFAVAAVAVLALALVLARERVRVRRRERDLVRLRRPTGARRHRTAEHRPV